MPEETPSDATSSIPSNSEWSSEKKIFWAIVAILVVAVAAVLLAPEVQERRQPEIQTAWVAIQPEGADAASVGRVDVEAGTSFTVHAVLEAETRDGQRIFYTEAPGLVLGGEEIPAEAIHRWDRPGEVKILWFTVEGSQPVLDLAPGDGLDRFRPLGFLRDDWPFAWSIPGRLEPANDDNLASEIAQLERPFGTQRYQVRVEVLKRGETGGELVSDSRYASWGGEQLLDHVEDFPTVVASLPGGAGPASSVFGLTQIRPPAGQVGATEDAGEIRPEALEEDEPEDGGDLWPGLVRLTENRVAFATLPLLREMLVETGEGRLPWSYLSLEGEARWGEDVHPGDVLRAGQRVVVLYTDAAPDQARTARPEGGNGVLDRDDLVFDFAFGAAVRPLSEVFEAEGGRVEWVPVGRAGS